MRVQTTEVFRDRASFVASVGGFLAQGVTRGEKVFVIAIPDMADALRPYVEGGDCVFLDAQQTLSRVMVAGRLEEARFMQEVGGQVEAAARSGGVRVYGEMVRLLGESGDWEAAAALERLWHGIGNADDSVLLALYSLDSFLHPTRSRALTQILPR